MRYEIISRLRSQRVKKFVPFRGVGVEEENERRIGIESFSLPLGFRLHEGSEDGHFRGSFDAVRVDEWKQRVNERREAAPKTDRRRTDTPRLCSDPETIKKPLSMAGPKTERKMRGSGGNENGAQEENFDRYQKKMGPGTDKSIFVPTVLEHFHGITIFDRKLIAETSARFLPSFSVGGIKSKNNGIERNEKIVPCRRLP